jgi:hypothetical protein
MSMLTVGLTIPREDWGSPGSQGGGSKGRTGVEYRVDFRRFIQG